MTAPNVPGRIRVAVVFGGRSAEHAISCVSAGNVLRALDPSRYEVVPIGITPQGRWVRADPDPDRWRILDGRLPEITDGTAVMLSGEPASSVVDVAVAPVDVVFPVLHGRYGEDGTIQGLLEMAGVPYVGSGVFASAAAMDKEFTKTLLGAAGLPVGRYVVLRPGAALSAADRAQLRLPVFVKPARAGSSIGITRVTDWADFDDALAVARSSDPKVIVEAAVVGREIECGVLGGVDGGPPEASLPGEIRVVSGHDWYDFEAKYLDDACEFDVPAVLADDVAAQLQDLARRAFVALDCAGLARVDFFLTPAGEPVINEVNTMPGFTRISMFPRMWQASGVGYPELMDRLISSALESPAAPAVSAPRPN